MGVERVSGSEFSREINKIYLKAGFKSFLLFVFFAFGPNKAMS
jgi:hypothetical protein